MSKGKVLSKPIQTRVRSEVNNIPVN